MAQRATSTCFCGACQIEVPVEGPDFIGSFVCHCTDDRKTTHSMFASNFIVSLSSLKHLRGESTLTKWSNSETIASGNTMTNHFCSICGTLLYRYSTGFPDCAIPRIGTVDDLSLHETKLRPKVEQFTKDKVNWVNVLEGEGDVERVKGAKYGAFTENKAKRLIGRKL